MELESALSLSPSVDGESSVPVRESREGGRLGIPEGAREVIPCLCTEGVTGEIGLAERP